MPKRIRLFAVVAASMLLVVGVMNLVLVVEGAPRVEPLLREGRTWQTGTGAPEDEGRHTWSFTVDPRGRSVVDLDVTLPYSVRVTHVAGAATLLHQVSWWVDGERLDEASRQVAAAPQENASRVSRTHSVPGSFAADLQVRRDAEQPFVLLVVWEWNATLSDDAEVTFTTTVRPVTVDPVDVGGLPGCSGSTCARVLLVVALLGQFVAVGWYRQAPAESGEAAGKRPRQRKSQ